MQRMNKLTLPVVLTYDGKVPANDIQAIFANMLELARIDGRLSTESMGEIGCVSGTVQFPEMETYDLYTGFSEVHDALQAHLGETFENLSHSITDNDRCTLAVYVNRIEFRASPIAPLITIFNKPTAHFTL